MTSNEATNGISLEVALTIIAAGTAVARERGLRPMSIAVLDRGGHLVAFQKEDGSANKRYEVAHGKAHGAISLGMGSRALHRRAEADHAFVPTVTATVGPVVPLPGGVLILDDQGDTVGVVGVAGDSPDHDEIVACAGVEAAGFRPDEG